MPAILLEPRTAKILPWLIAVGFFMQSLDATIVNTALPAMAADLGENPLRMQAVVIAYMLTVAVLIPTSGWIADRFGTQRTFIGAIGLFSLGSLLCAMSPNLSVLVVARVLQGLGGALMMPVGRLVILRAYPRTELVRILSFITIPGLIGPLSGPALGGWMVEALSWHWIFLINLPVGALGIWAARQYMPDLRAELQRFDVLGFVMFGVSMLLISIALEGLGDLQLPPVRVVLLLMGGLVCQIAYWLRALRVEAPLFSASLFSSRTFAVGIFGNIFTRLGSGALPFLTPLLLQLGLGYSPSLAGMCMIPLAAGAMLSKTFAKGAVDRFGYRRLLLGNTLLLGCMIASMGLIGEDTPFILILVLLSLLGVVNSMQFTAMNTVTLIDLSEQQAASGNSLLSLVMQLALSMGVACAAAILGGFSQEAVERTQVLAAFQLTYLCVGLLTMLAAAIFFQLRPEDGRASRRVATEAEQPGARGE